jgi:phosphotriesterase-related protein
VKEKKLTELADLFIKELTEDIEGIGVKAGFIKVASSNNGPTDLERKVMEAATIASKETGSSILAHSLKWEGAKEHISLLSKYKCDYDRYIWAHAHRETNINHHYHALSLGCYMEYDGIGIRDEDDSLVLDLLEIMKAKGYGNKVLISQDRGWYNPALPQGGQPKPYTYITDIFLNKMRALGLDESYIDELLRKNPFNAMARCTKDRFLPCLFNINYLAY